MRNGISSLKLSLLLTFVLSVTSTAHAFDVRSFTCQAIPNSGIASYDSVTTCTAVVYNPGKGAWYNAVGQDCATVCSQKRMVNAYSPDGFKCASGEERPQSGMGKIDYSPTGCWGSCSTAFGPSGAVSVGGRCYHPTQKHDNDRTDTTVACFCTPTDEASNKVDVQVAASGSEEIKGVSITPTGFGTITSQSVNDVAPRIFTLVGVIPTQQTASLSMKVKVQGACGSAGSLALSLSQSGGSVTGTPTPKTVALNLPACAPILGQCSDGKDNDQDGVTDRYDPACWTDASNPNTYDAKRGPESAATTQCQDAVDNDTDSLVDAADPGCINPGGATVNNRFIDARMDQWMNTHLVITSGQSFTVTASGRATLAGTTIPVTPDGISPASLTNKCRTPGAEGLPIGALVGKIGANGTAFLIGSSYSKVAAATGKLFISINDGLCAADNLGGFSVAVTGTTRAYDKTRTLESAATSQCQDGKDNDSDGLMDTRDPGCFTDPRNAATFDRTRDNEAAAGPGECIDGRDNDNDGVVDGNDPGCWTNTADASTYNAYGGPESGATTQCQDTKDNDGDGVIDANDPGCRTNPSSASTFDRTRNNEGAANLPQCADGKDNDQDNLTDLADPGCANAADTNEGDEPSLLTLGVECVTDNTDNTKTAYFSYNNLATGDLSVATNAQSNTLNEYVTNGAKTAQPTAFKKGLAKGAVVATFSSDSLTWVVRAPGSALSQVTANAQTPRCGKVTLTAECRGYKQGVMQVRFGYNNPNAFPLVVAAGTNNGFSPSTADRGQPRTFLAGNNSSAFEAPLTNDNEVLTWSVNGSTATAPTTIAACNGQCTNSATSSVTGKLDAVAGQLAGIMDRAAALLASSKASRDGIKRNRVDATRAKKKAVELLQQANAITIEYPAVVKTCAEAPQFCSRIDRGPSLDKLTALYNEMYNSTRRIINRAYFRNSGKTNGKDPLIVQAKSLRAQGAAAVLALPRVAVECK